MVIVVWGRDKVDSVSQGTAATARDARRAIASDENDTNFVMKESPLN
jgi:hypothetical protein